MTIKNLMNKFKSNYIVSYDKNFYYKNLLICHNYIFKNNMLYLFLGNYYIK